MKHLASCAMLLFVSFISLTGFSQNGNIPKPKQFSNYPDIINCPEATLSSIFSATAGQNINLSFSGDFSFPGNVASNIVKYSNLQSAVIRSPVFNNSIFSVSKIINSDNTVSYTGRIIHRDFFDGYELKRNAAGNYQLIKIETGRMIPDCRPL